MIDQETRISEDLAVNEVIRRYPATVAVFKAYGIDSCCGGALPLGEAAVRHDRDPEELLLALNGIAMASGEGLAPRSQR